MSSINFHFDKSRIRLESDESQMCPQEGISNLREELLARDETGEEFQL